jgi:hypothetical protein
VRIRLIRRYTFISLIHGELFIRTTGFDNHKVLQPNGGIYQDVNIIKNHLGSILSLSCNLQFEMYLLKLSQLIKGPHSSAFSVNWLFVSDASGCERNISKRFIMPGGLCALLPTTNSDVRRSYRLFCSFMGDLDPLVE